MMRKAAFVSAIFFLLLSIAACGKPGDTSGDASEVSDYTTQASEDTNEPSGTSTDVSNTDSQTKDGGASKTNSPGKTGKSPTTLPTKLEQEQRVDVTVPKANISGQKVSVMSWGAANEPSVISQKSLFKKLYGATLDWQTVSWSDYANTFTSRSMAGNPPDVVTLRNEDRLLMVYRNMGQQLEDKIDFNSALWSGIRARNESYKFNGHIYRAITSAYVGYYVWYNKTILMNEGQPDPATLYSQGKWTWKALMDIAKATTRDTNSSGKINQFGFSTNHPAITAGALLCAYNTDVVQRNADGSYKLNFDDPNVDKAYGWIYDMYNGANNVCAPMTENNLTIFAQGRAAMYFDGSWIGHNDPIKTLHKNGTVSYVPAPKVPGSSDATQWASFDEYMIPKGKSVNVNGAVAYINMRRYSAIDKKQGEENKKELLSIGYTEAELKRETECRANAKLLDYVSIGNIMANEIYLAAAEVAGYSTGQAAPWATVKEVHRGHCQQSIDELNNFIKKS